MNVNDCDQEEEDTVDASSDEMNEIKNDDSTIKHLCRDIFEDEIRYDPDWQREYIWTQKRASQLIESILLGIPIPMIFLSKNTSIPNKTFYDVIDGKQRLHSIFMFRQGKLILYGLQKLTNLNGLDFAHLQSEYQDKFLGYTMRVSRISASDSNFVFMIFERLNAGGVKLNGMEIRNCMYAGSLISSIKDELADPQKHGIKWFKNNVIKCHRFNNQC